MRTKKAIYSIILSYILQMIRFISGLLIPPLIISRFGSEVNGTIASISNFIGYMTLLEAGIGGLAVSQLYKPIADKDSEKIGGIFNSIEKTFRKIAIFSIAYSVVLAFVYPLLVNSSKSSIWLFTLVIILSTRFFITFYFCNGYSVILRAHNEIYIIYFVEILVVIINLLITIALVYAGMDIRIVQIGSIGVFALKPVMIYLYIRKRYLPKIIIKNRDSNILSQRWDAIYQYAAQFVSANIGIVVITLFINLEEVSVYSLYSAITFSLAKLVESVSSGIQATFGDMIAKEEKDKLKKYFMLFEFLSVNISMILFITVATMIAPFMKIYIGESADVNYIRYTFGYLMALSALLKCISDVYFLLPYVAGQFKKTNKIPTTEAIINVVLSVAFVNIWGINGVVVATIFALLYRAIAYVIYISRNTCYYCFKSFIKRTCISIVIIACSLYLLNTHVSVNNIHDYIDWMLCSGLTVLLVFCVVLVLNTIFYRSELKIVGDFVQRLRIKRRS